MAFNAWRKWLDRTFGRTRTPPICRTIPLRLERLEDRWVPSITATGQALSFTEGASSTVVAATFTDTTPSPAADYTAAVNWGDGTTTAGTVTLSAGTYTVTGSHTYADEGTFTATESIHETVGDLDTGTATSTASVAEGDFGTLTPATITPSEGMVFSGSVASFADIGNPSQVASDFTATINWGDGTTTTGTVTGGTGGPFTISGSHTYADEGTFTVLATFSDDPPSTLTNVPITSKAVVADADTLTGTSGIGLVTEGQTNTIPFTFIDSYTGNTASDFTATINWGDGTVTAGTVTGSGSSYTVSGQHSYADEGSFTATATLTDDAPGTASATSTLTITASEGDTLAPASVQPNATLTEGTFTSAMVAVFSDSGYSTNSPSDFTASINWGDGTVTAGTVSGGSGSFTVSGSHTYADEGTFTPTVVLSDDAPGTATTTASGTVNVAEGDTLGGTITAPGLTEGTAFSGAVATFTDTYAGNTAGDFTATINWGDGTLTAGTVSGGSGRFTVSGSHTYADEAIFAAFVGLNDDAPGTATTVAGGPITVAEADTLSGTVSAAGLAEGTAFTGAVATFTDTFAGNTPADFLASINWGDGGVAVGTVSGSSGTFTVSGSHTYADEGTFTATVRLLENGPSTVTATAVGTISVADADVLNGSAPPIQTAQGTPVSGTIATFTDSFTGNSAADFTASINWGDGTTTAGTVAGGSGSYSVSGSHTYTASGPFTVAVTLSDDAPGTASRTVTTTASVSGDAVVSGHTLVLTETLGGGVGSITYVLDGGAPVALTGVHSFTFNGLAGNDTMIVDCVNGKPLVPGDVFYNGGTGFNNLTVTAAGFVVRTVPGAFTIADPVTVHYSNIQTTNVNNAAAVDAFAGPHTAGGTPFVGLSANERFVQALYLDELGRAGAKSELDGWAAFFNGATQGQGQVAIATGIQHSAEARDHLVRSWYVAFLGRQAGAGEEQGWVSQLLAGAREEQVLSQILASPEFYARAQTLISLGSADDRFVQALYLVLLNRTASSAEQLAWLSLLPSTGRQGAAQGFLTSGEFRTDQFEGYYNALLHRPDDQPGLNNWVFSNFDVASVRIGFESGSEFFANG
jgi:hypothetical protein